ncbi:hypothetical protein [Glycomyces buryatensis]|uniref:Uncharacterized protein n=1 Tax=Glycomyces buryatensis TaxID=2570927 RepID=A0A4S8QFF3_9ACTN|nr:hypothetical protein [Glycomyces buryatensis]THV43397.1 hypothetical protein FAB82_01615 [Glycomyces buryatensis]
MTHESGVRPSFSDAFAARAAGYYRLAWTADGFPGQLQQDGSIWEHPIYPTYVLKDYLAQ